MSTPEKPRPSIDDTLRAIDEAIDALASEMAAQPQCRRCARQAIIGSELCAYHLQLDPRETMIEELGPIHRRSCQHTNLPVPGCPGCKQVDDDLIAARANAAALVLRPAPARGWLRPLLDRLFGDGAS